MDTWSDGFTGREFGFWAGAFLVVMPVVGYVGGSLGIPLPVLMAGGIASGPVLVLARVVWRRARR